MNICYLYIQVETELNECADLMRKVFNIPPYNISPEIIDQKRFGLNYGGDYYLFEFFGLKMFLMNNTGDVGDFDFCEYRYCIEIQSDICVDEEKFNDGLVFYIRTIFEEAGVKTVFED